VGHDHRADQPRADAPARRVDEILLLVAAEELDLERLGKILRQVVARPHLQRLAVLHEAFDAVRRLRAGELFRLGLLALDDRHREHVLDEVGVDVEHF
jgi:hypothetical protein